MTKGRVRYVVRTLAEITAGHRVFGGPLSRELLEHCPADIEVDLLIGQVATTLSQELAEDLAKPYIDFVRGELARDRGAPTIEQCKLALRLGPATNYSTTSAMRYNLGVKRHPNGDAYGTYQIKDIVTSGQQYQVSMQGFVVHAGIRHDFHDEWTMQIEGERSEP